MAAQENRPQRFDGSGGGRTGLRYFKPLAGLEVAFAAKPVFHGGLQAVERDFVADFEHTAAGGQGVVKGRVLVAGRGSRKPRQTV